MIEVAIGQQLLGRSGGARGGNEPAICKKKWENFRSEAFFCGNHVANSIGIT